METLTRGPHYITRSPCICCRKIAYLATLVYSVNRFSWFAKLTKLATKSWEAEARPVQEADIASTERLRTYFKDTSCSAVFV